MENDMDLITWGEKYATGIELIDSQHKELVKLTNELYHICRTRNEDLPQVFKTVMGRMVDYVKLHFTAELGLLKKIKYPQYKDHKEQHVFLIKQILAAANEYSDGKRFVPQNFVRTLKDWIFGHIAFYDKQYAAYIADQKRKGLLTDAQIEG